MPCSSRIGASSTSRLILSNTPIKRLLRLLWGNYDPSRTPRPSPLLDRHQASCEVGGDVPALEEDLPEHRRHSGDPQGPCVGAGERPQEAQGEVPWGLASPRCREGPDRLSEEPLQGSGTYR